MDPRTGDSFRLNETGSSILKFLQEGKNEQEIAAKLAEDYDISTDSATTDVFEFKALLCALGFEE